MDMFRFQEFGEQESNIKIEEIFKLSKWGILILLVYGVE